MGTIVKTNELVRPRFAPRGAFSRDLDVEAKAYFEGSGRTRRDVPRMFLKSAIILVWFVSSWTFLVFFTKTGLEAAFASVSLGLSIAAIGMSVQHDANHSGTSEHGWVNRFFGATLDVMGVCSYIWRQKHNVGHHTFTNIQDVDHDLDFGILARLSPEQPRRPWHRYQHLYLWFFYGFLLPKWVFYDDFVVMRSRMIGRHALPPPSRGILIGFVAWKLFFIAWAIVIPALYHPLWQVAVFHLVACFALGGTLGTVFQLAHCSRDADFPASKPGERLEEWTAHQVATTVDFSPRSAIISWFVGGLNFQVEHHLFPKVCHVHYPALSEIVARLSKKHGIRYRTHLTLAGALTAHFHHLRDLGRPLVAALTVEPLLPLEAIDAIESGVPSDSIEPIASIAPSPAA